MGALTRRVLAAVLALACSGLAFGCSAQPSSGDSSASQQQSETAANAYLSGTLFAPATEAAINDFIASYGKDAPGWDGDAYVVSDFDNTTSIFDIADQCNAFQLQTMAFALDPESLRSALAASLDEGANENALWLDDVEKAYRYLWDTYGPFSPAGLDEQGQAAIQADPQWAEFAAKMKAFHEHVGDTIDDPTACEWVLHWCAGMTEDEVYALFKRSCEMYEDADTELATWTSPESIESKIGVVSCEFPLGVSVTDDVKAMLKAYSENGIDVWICSASHVDGVRAAVDAYGLGDYVHGVIGMTQKSANDIYIPAYDWETGYAWLNAGDGAWQKADSAIRALPSREGKVQAIENALVPMYGCGPLAGFMDASGDFNFCTEFDSMKMVICYNRANRKITDGAGLVGVVAVYQQESLGYDLATANAAGDTYYLLQGRDENGKRTLRPSSETVKLGQAEPKLFANADNEALLAYLKSSNLTTAEVFNTFAIRCEKNSPNNVLGIDYGYLAEYDGYHSHDGVYDGDALPMAA
ncbi:MAG: HAD family hydrolase [Eggerthellaceae bacterium]|nr:HAD family hydrolase [Eggerthellaceae bacterium]